MNLVQNGSMPPISYFFPDETEESLAEEYKTNCKKIPDWLDLMLKQKLPKE